MKISQGKLRRLASLPPTRFKTYTVQRAGAQFERLLAEVAAGCVVEITRRGKAVASVLDSATLETLEILANPEAMKAIRRAKAGKCRDWPLSAIKADLPAPRRKLSLVEHMRKFKGVRIPEWP